MSVKAIKGLLKADKEAKKGYQLYLNHFGSYLNDNVYHVIIKPEITNDKIMEIFHLEYVISVFL